MSPEQIIAGLGGPRKVRAYAAMVTAVIGAFLATMHFGEVAEPYWLATRGYTRELMKVSDTAAKQRSDAQTQQIIALALSTKEAERRSVQGRMDRSDVELRKLPSDASDSLKELIRQQIATYQRQRDNIDVEISELRRQQSGGHP